ncbi:LLM class flavin-dependent oxidoreductase [Microbacterium sp. NPDC055903]
MSTAGLFLIPPLSPDPTLGYRAALDAAAEAERVGFDSVWLAEGHVRGNGLPSALTFLAALSQRTSRVRLGTAVITPAFEHPIRLAEAVGVVDALSGGRLELGLGKSNGGGWSSPAFSAFSLDEAERDALFARAIDGLRDALDGIVDGRELPLYPPAGSVRGRIWQATGSAETATAIGQAGDGLLLHRKAAGGETGRVQAGLADAYLDALPADAEPRIAASRVVLPAASRAAAVELFRRGVQERPEHYARFDPASDAAAYLADANIAFGTTDEIADRLAADAAVARSSTVLYSVPLPFDAPEFRRALTRVMEEIHPRVSAVATVRR